MTEERQKRNNAVKRLALAPTGISERVQRVFQVEVANSQDDLWVLQLPVDSRFQVPLHDNAGNPILMYGVTPYGVGYYGGVPVGSEPTHPPS